MDEESLRNWFDDLKKVLEESYLQHTEPWKQSGFSGPEERWISCRKPIADGIDKDGSFLDIGCANGYLLECVIKWNEERGIKIIPYGIDLSEKLIGLAKKRLPQYKSNLYVGNGLTWNPPLKFDYVRTEAIYVPEELQERYIRRLLSDFVVDDGKLLVAEYRGRKDSTSKKWIDEFLRKWNLSIESVKSGFYEDKELTRIVVVRK